jgi:hypothetical protein
MPDSGGFADSAHGVGNNPAVDSPENPAKKQSKWTPEEDALIIELKRKSLKWEDISKRLPGRSPTSCRLHYQNYLEKRSAWDEERKNQLACLYERSVHSGYLWKTLYPLLHKSSHILVDHY